MRWLRNMHIYLLSKFLLRCSGHKPQELSVLTAAPQVWVQPEEACPSLSLSPTLDFLLSLTVAEIKANRKQITLKKYCQITPYAKEFMWLLDVGFLFTPTPTSCIHCCAQVQYRTAKHRLHCDKGSSWKLNENWTLLQRENKGVLHVWPKLPLLHTSPTTARWLQHDSCPQNTRLNLEVISNTKSPCGHALYISSALHLWIELT